MSSAQFEFNQQLMPQNLLEVEEVGDLCIEASNDDGFYYYLIIKTVLGESKIFAAGPVIPEYDELVNGFNVSYNVTQYKEEKLIKTINTWLNDSKKKLTNASMVELSSAIGAFRDVKDVLREFDSLIPEGE